MNLETFEKKLDEVYETQDMKQVEDFLLSAAANMECEYDPSLLPAVYNEMGSFYRGTSRYEKSIDAFRRCGEMIRRESGTRCVEYATLLNNMAGTYRLKGELDTARKLFQEAVDIFQECGAQGSYPCVSTLNNLALVYCAEGSYKEAAENLEEALSLIRGMEGHENELAVTYANLASLYLREGESKKARKALEDSIAVFEKLPPEDTVHFAAALNSLAVLEYREGNTEEAIQLYRRSAANTRRFFGENVEYGITLENIGRAYEQIGDKRLAMISYEKAARVFTSLFGADDERTKEVAGHIRRLQGGDPV